MKKIVTFLALVFTITAFAQAPQGFNYQATVRNSAGELIINTNVYFKFNVIQGSQTAVPIFTETHYVPTDDLGQVNLVIGQGTATTGAFSDLDWSLGNYYLGIELNTGSGYLAMGTTQLLSVPYALYAANSGNGTAITPNLESVLAEGNSANNQQIKDLQDPTEAQDAVTKAYVDALPNSEGFINFNGWDNYQIWNDDSRISPQPNSFWFINAKNTTITLPASSTYGDVIRIYYMGGGIDNSYDNNGFTTYIDASTNNVKIGWLGRINSNYGYKIEEGVTKPFQLSVGLNTLIFIGDRWMLGEIDENQEEFDSDNDGFTSNDGDCDDHNATVYSGATEINDGIDNDCDGEIDEGFGGTLQERLDNGQNPYQIYLSDNSLLEDLYGLTYNGGLIFYLNINNGSGMVAAPSDQGVAKWGCRGEFISNASNPNIGSGNQNTNLINTICNETGIAADICVNLTLNGYDDWYLPSKDELNLIYTNLHQRGLGGFDTTTVLNYGVKGVYWSSTDGETNGEAAWIQMFGSQGEQYTYDFGVKDNTLLVRAIRSF